MNLPNLISSIRILMVPVFVYFCISGRPAAAIAVLAVCALSDVLDGMIARRFNMVTDLGKILDPVADKLIQAAMMLCISFKIPQIWILLGLHMFRELLLSAVGLYVVRSTGRVCGAKWYGKLCTAVIYASMLLLLAMPGMPVSIINGLLLLCSALIIMCLLMYFAGYMRMLKAGREPDII